MIIEVNDAIGQQYLTCKQLCEKYSWPPIGGLRHLIFHANTNGFKNVVRKVGKRVLLNEDAFLKFMEGKFNEGK